MNRRKIVRRLPAPLRHGLIDAATAVRQFQGTITKSNVGAYWTAPPDDGNEPEAYADDARHWDIDFLLPKVRSLLPNGGVVLEFGCNAGRVLRHFAEGDRYQPIGVEFNPRAIEVGKVRFPALNRARFLVGDGAKTLPTIAAASVDLAYSSHALRHVGNDTIQKVATELSRVTKSFLIISEDEGCRRQMNFPRNYRRLFEPLGWREIEKHYSMDLGEDSTISMMSTVRIFRRA
jgi:SAM-dependent methyltransferase